jgi:hypothetical protein
MGGPGLTEDMDGPRLIGALNAWGAARDRELFELRANLSDTQVGVAAAFDQAKAALLSIVCDFRLEAETMRQQHASEVALSVSRLEQVVTEARLRFGTQDVHLSAGLSALALRQQAIEAWAAAEPARMVAAVQTAPARTWVPVSPGGTPCGSFYPPGIARQAPGTPPARPAQPAAFQSPAAAQPQQQQQQPQPQQPEDPWASFQPAAAADPWAAGRLSPSAPRHFDMGTPGDKGGGKGAYAFPREMRIDQRSWGDHKKLDVGTTFDSFQVWKDRAMMFLSRERPDVRRLLTWAETQSKENLEADLPAQAALFGVVDVASAEYAIHDGIKSIITDSLLGRARNCVERGCELWRALCAEWSGAAPQLKQAKARRYQEPARCKDISELWSRLPAWVRLGEEVKAAGLDIPEWLRSAALEKLLPAPLLATLIARPELATYAQRIGWVETQMEHSRGMAQATAYAPGSGKDASGDVYMNSLEAPAGHPCSEHSEGLAWAFADAMAAGDWAQCGAISALKGGKGRKGLGKGGPKGASPGKGADAATEFTGACNYCGIWGHRKSDCRRYTADLAKQGGAKSGGKGDKGAGKGGKGGKGSKGSKGQGPLMECAAAAEEEEHGEEEEWAGEQELAEEWFFNHTIGSLSAAAGPKTKSWIGGTVKTKSWIGGTVLGAASGSSLPVTRAEGQTILGAASASGLPRAEGQTITRAKGQTRAEGQTYFGVASAGNLPFTRAEGQTIERAGAKWPLPGPSAFEHMHSGPAVRGGRGPTGQSAPPSAPRRATRVYNRFDTLNLLVGDDAAPLLATVSGEMRGGRVVEAVVDSGAVHSVAPPGFFPGLVTPSPWSRAGRGYRAANGTAIRNLGQVQVPFGTGEGHKCLIPFQVAEVEQPLLSVAHLTAAGNICELGHADGRVVNIQTGRSIALQRRGGVYIMKMFLPDAAAQLPFRRQGA